MTLGTRRKSFGGEWVNRDYLQRRLHGIPGCAPRPSRRRLKKPGGENDPRSYSRNATDASMSPGIRVPMYPFPCIPRIAIRPLLFTVAYQAELFSGSVSAKIQGFFAGQRIEVLPVRIVTGRTRHESPFIKRHVGGQCKRRFNVHRMRGLPGMPVTRDTYFSYRFLHASSPLQNDGLMTASAFHAVGSKVVGLHLLRGAGIRRCPAFTGGTCHGKQHHERQINK